MLSGEFSILEVEYKINDEWRSKICSAFFLLKHTYFQQKNYNLYFYIFQASKRHIFCLKQIYQHKTKPSS